MKKPAIFCDSEKCPEVVREENAPAMGWLTIGGGRRGRYRMDLCPHHTRQAIKLISETTKKRVRR